MPNRKTPSYTTVYDHQAEGQIRYALGCYARTLPSISTSMQVEDTFVLEQLATAERILFVFSSAFGLVNSEGEDYVKSYQPAPLRTASTLAHVTRIFTSLQSLVDHPAFVMLSTCSAVVDRRRPTAALRDIRWYFKPESAGLSVTDTPKLFLELAALLHQMVEPLKQHPMNVMTQTAIADFEGFMYADDGACLVNSINFGTAASLAQSTVESARRR